jgi:hypothetical protein
MFESRWSALLIACLFAWNPSTTHAAPQDKVAPSSQTPRTNLGAPKLDEALQTLKQHAARGEVADVDRDGLIAAVDEDFNGLAGATPDCRTVRARLNAAVKDVCSRAKQSTVAPEEFDALRADVCDARMREAISNAKGKSAEETKASLSGALQTLVASADALDPASSALSEHGKKLLGGLASKQSLTAADLAPLAREVSRAAVLRAEAILESRAASKPGASQTDYDRVRNGMLDHVALVAPSEQGEVQAELTSLLDGIRRKPQGAPLAPKDFEELRKFLQAHLGVDEGEPHILKG